ncbi:MAG: MarC family protein [Nitrospirae bacterium]|nr:MarC family protein [Nitrospirota bacterium]
MNRYAPLFYTFIPLFVAIDILGVLPVYFNLTDSLAKPLKKKIALQSVATAFFVSVFFIIIGQGVFRILGIRVEDFMIAGGVLLLVFAITDLVRQGEKKIAVGESIGIVPLGTPIIAGPATLTTAMILAGSYPMLLVILSIFLNLIIAWLVFYQADRIIKVLGINGSRALAKVAGLLLAAIAVSMMRRGIMGLLAS